MQEVFEKIIGELNNYIKDNDATYNTNQNYNGAGAFLKAIDVVEQAAEEFATYTNVGSKGWISCSKELPPQPKENPIFDSKPLELYLVTEKYADYPIRAFWNGKFFTDGWSKVDVLAWQPLPEPYTKGE